MRTRTAPSDRPSTPAISAVDISSTKRRMSARRRSPGSRPIARHASTASSWSRGVGFEVARRGDGHRGLERRLGPPASLPAPFGHRIAGDLEEPHPERRGALAVGGAGPLLEPGEVRQRVEEGALGRVLRLVVIAQLVEGVAVHLGQVLPIEGLEAGRVRLGRLDEPTVTVEVGKARTPLLRTVHSSRMPDGASRYTAAVSGWSSRTWRISPTITRRSPPAVVRIGDDQGPGRLRRPRAASTDTSPADVSSRTVRPVVTWRAAHAGPRSRPPGAPRRSARAVRGRRRGAGPSRRDGRRPLRAATSSTRPGPAGSRRRPNPC